MDKRPDQTQESKKPTNGQPSESNKTSSQPKEDSPMGRFNTAMRKILSAPKKDIKKK